jgi:hypothetical protein
MSVRRLVLSFLFCLPVALVAGPPAAAGPGSGHPSPRAAHVRCADVAASGVGQDLGGGRTTATISVAGEEVGTTAAAFTITGVDGTVASFTGPITFTGRGGTLTAQVNGSLDLTNGSFTSTSTSLAGTGAYRRVTGQLTLTGTEDLTTGVFTEVITGQLCLTRGNTP